MHTPETDHRWARLSAGVLAEIAAIDARRLEVERAGLSPDRRAALAEPVYSVRTRFVRWEYLIGLLEAGPAPIDYYAFSEYENDLDTRSNLEAVLLGSSESLRSELGPLRKSLDDRFMDATRDDVTGDLDPWLRAWRDSAPAGHGWWRRVPKAVPWDR
ncbi:hypothetical protein [Streptomyces sp. NPDC058279]|uniref:hypothetical protein n=1 Tax=Streptomyces sp. NPDC058279 TaxID=3346418 RepID=UPI0036E7F755